MAVYMKATSVEQLAAETLEALSCELDRRPKGSLTFGDVAERVRSVQREGDWLIVQFDPAAAELVADYAAAERLCCRTIDWRVETTPTVRLLIGGTPTQVSVLEELFSTPERPEHQEAAA
jgi:hypothetical protein